MAETEHASRAKHRQRAVAAIAEHICVTDFTDGFCGPKDGVCYGVRTGGKDCTKVAEGCMKALETRGLMVVWPYDKERT